MKNKKLIIVLSGCAVILLASYAVLQGAPRSETKASSSASVPSEQAVASADAAAPHSQIDEILAITPTSPEHPADPKLTEAFRAKQACYYSRSELESVKQLLVDCESLKGIAEVKDRYKECSALKPDQEAQRIKLDKKSASCTSDSAQLKQDYSRSVDAAANRGDVDAQMCFMNLADQGLSTASNPEARTGQYAKAAFARGDWRIVDYVNSLPLNSRNAVTQLFGNDLAARYRMNRLLRKGAIGDYARLLDQLADSDAAAKGENGQPLLAPGEMTKAEGWANQAYVKYFKNSPSLQSAPVLCAGSDDTP